MEDKVLLDVQGLKTYFHTFKGVVKAVDNVSFSLKEGEILGIVGESGSGKSVTSFSILKLVEDPGVVDADHIMFDGKDLAKISEKDMSKIRGKRHFHGIPGSYDIFKSSLYHPETDGRGADPS